MTIEEIIENNKLIAEFMKYDWENYKKVVIQEDPSYSQMHGDKEVEVPVEVEDLQYHKNWNWLMPVVEKIGLFLYPDGKAEEHDYAYMRTFNNGMARINRFRLHEAPTQIEATYQAVIEFIKWHNENGNK